MARRWRGLAAGGPLFLIALACGSSGLGGERGDGVGFRIYAEEVARGAGATLTVSRCGMTPPGSRLGRCELMAAPGAADTLVRAYALAPIVDADEWRTSFNSGCAESGWTAAHPAALLFDVSDAALPASHGRGVIERVWIDGDAVCFDHRYPYG